MINAIDISSKHPNIGKDVNQLSGSHICYGAKVNSGVTIGENSKIYSGVVISADVPENTYVIEYPETRMLLIALHLGSVNDGYVNEIFSWFNFFLTCNDKKYLFISLEYWHG